VSDLPCHAVAVRSSPDGGRPFYRPNAKPPPPGVALPGEVLFEFVRASDSVPMTSELRFNGELYGWEAEFFGRGEQFVSRGGFVTRALAVQCPEIEGRHFESPSHSDARLVWPQLQVART
jgi:hypothetical protein